MNMRTRFPEILVSYGEGREPVTGFETDEEPGQSPGAGGRYITQVGMTFHGVPEDLDFREQAAVDEGDVSGLAVIGALSGHLILCRQMIADGLDPVAVCDDISADLGYCLYGLYKKDGPLHEHTRDVFIIDEMHVTDPCCGLGIGSRILAELPFLLLDAVHVRPGVLAYYVSEDADARLGRFYGRNGFVEAGIGRLLYWVR